MNITLYIEYQGYLSDITLYVEYRTNLSDITLGFTSNARAYTSNTKAIFRDPTAVSRIPGGCISNSTLYVQYPGHMLAISLYKPNTRGYRSNTIALRRISRDTSYKLGADTRADQQRHAKEPAA